MNTGHETKRILPGAISYLLIAFYGFILLVGLAGMPGWGFSSSDEIASLIFGLALSVGGAVGVWWFIEWVVVDYSAFEIAFFRVGWSRRYSTNDGVAVFVIAKTSLQPFEIEIHANEGATAADPIRPLGWGSSYCLRRFKRGALFENVYRLRDADTRTLVEQVSAAADPLGTSKPRMVGPHLALIYDLSQRLPDEDPYSRIAELAASLLAAPMTRFDPSQTSSEMRAILETGE